MNLAKYRKLIVSVLGALLVIGSTFFGLDLEAKGITAETIVGFAVPILTALGVWAVPNDSAT